ncbi:hypothetical protein KA005_55905 [bacterium]|nr:hypothetical protein [bacterium]
MNTKNKAIEHEDQSENLPAELKAKFDLKSNMEGVAPRLPQVNIVHQAQLFTFPDETQLKEFEGIILDTNRINAWWDQSYDETGGGTPPDCFSMNGIEPDLNCNMPQAKRCAECEKNKFGSDGRGKACKNMKRVHIMLEDEMLPHRLTLPPSNLKAIDMYISLLTSKGMPYQLVVTNFKLKKAQNKDGIAFSEINPEKTGIITDPEKAEFLSKMLREFKPVMRGQEIVMEEYVSPDTEEM